MKTAKRIITILVALVMVLGTCSSAFAFDFSLDFLGQGSKGNYVAIGDSITRGCFGFNDTNASAIDNYEAQDEHNCRIVEQSFTYKIAKALGYVNESENNIKDKNSKYWPLAMNAVTTAFVLDLLGIEDNYHDTEYLHSGSGIITRRYKTMYYYFGEGLSKTPDNDYAKSTKNEEYKNYGTIKPAKELIKDADLITIELGLSDVFYRAKQLAVKSVDFSNTDEIIKTVKNLVSEMFEGYAYWYLNFPRLLDYLKDNIRTDCEVIILGTINPAFNLNLSSDYYLPVGNAISVITDLMNRRYEHLAKQYGFKYVDISNVETGMTLEDVTLDKFIYAASSSDLGDWASFWTHPTPDGYTQIANWIIDALADESGFSCKTTIKLDAGRITDVSSVRVNGIERKFYYKDKDGKLCIPCLTRLAKTLAVYGKDGKQLSLYILDYDNGYTAKRLYTTNDINAVKESLSLDNFINQAKGLLQGID